jgi:hypothetical protein
MKMKTVVTLSLVGLFCAGSGVALAADPVNVMPRCPVPFAAWDTDGSGGIDPQEFAAVREQRQAAAQAAGRQGRNMVKASPFSQIDSNSDGVISQEELAVVQAVHRQLRPAVNRGGCDTGWGGCNTGWGGCNTGRLGGMGKHQNMDAETRQKYDKFLVATLALRQDIAAKRMEKRTAMCLAKPDADRAALLTRELIELRCQLMKQADKAGVPFGYGMKKGHGGWEKGSGNGNYQR